MTSTWLDLVIWDWEGRKRWKGPKEIFHRGRHWSLTPCGACGLLTGLCKTILVNKEPFSIRAGSQEQKSFGVSWFFRGGNTLRDYPAGWENWHWLLLPPFHTVAQEVFSLPFAFSLGLFLLLHSASFFHSSVLLFHSAFFASLLGPFAFSLGLSNQIESTWTQLMQLLSHDGSYPRPICTLVVAWNNAAKQHLRLMPRSRSAAVSPLSGSCHCNFSLRCPPKPGLVKICCRRSIFKTRVIRPSCWIRFHVPQFTGSTNQSEITWSVDSF